MAPTTSTEDVLVVGGGPVGLTLASELHRHGVPCRIVDKLDRPHPDSRATDIQARTLEVLHDMGVVDELLALGHPHRGFSLFADGRWLARMNFERLDTPYPYALGLPQDVTERVLAEHLEKLGGRLERNVEVARVEPHEEDATATLLHADGRWEKVRARYVVGCDGASSAVRIGLGLPFDGISYEERFLMADAKLSWDEPHDNIYLFYGAESFMLVLPLPGEGTVRLFTNEPSGDEPLPLTIDTFRDLFARAVPLRASLERPGWMSRFRIHKRIVPRYRVGNVFLAGDAAHIHSPVTGQGMNLGIQDAYNLAWKLALVVRGRAPTSLLDSYEPERRPHACAVLEESDKNQRRAAIKSRFGQALRNNVLEVLTRFPSLTRRIGEMNSQIGVHYRASPIVAESRTSVFSANWLEDRTTEHPTVRDWRDFDAAPAAGDRAPDLALGDGATLFERLRGTHHTLLLFDGRAPTSGGYAALARAADGVAARWDELVRPAIVVYGAKMPPELAGAVAGRVWLDPEGQLHARFGAGSECLYLIRPDGYVGFRAQPADAGALERYLARVLV
jgi:2-polyprenyl-6-methoxyphenol hydroxylase-like FAD-dependent oxidoreductase